MAASPLDSSRTPSRPRMPAPARDEVEQVGRGRRFGEHRDRVPCDGVLQPQVQPDLLGAAHACVDVRADQYDIGADVLMDPLERVGGVAVGGGQSQLDFHPRHVFARDSTELLAGGQLGRQHFTERRRQPRALRAAREVLEAEHGNRSPGLRRRGRGR
jgi:hypothetical protein